MRKRHGFIYVDKDDDGKGTCERSLRSPLNWYKVVLPDQMKANLSHYKIGRQM